MTETETDSEKRSAPTRRTVVAAAAGTAAALPLLSATGAVAAGAEREPAFLHGVASGDPLPDGVVLWTRVTPAPEATPGSGLGADTTVRWEIAEDAGFRTGLRSGSVVATAGADHTVKADVRGLQPATTYHYRFTAGGTASPVGRTRTAPAAGDTVHNVRFGVVSCSNYEAGYFAAYRHLAARPDLDAVLHLGDYIYEYGNAEYPSEPARLAQPPHETVTLADYRTRHAHYRTDDDLRALHAAHPVIAIWDDHEVANDAWSGGAENHSPETEGPWAQRVAAAKRAYFEWMPVRPSTEGTVYRRLRFGDDTVDSPDRTLTGRTQLEWLKSGLAASQARWRLVGTSVMISPLALGSLPSYLLGPIAECLGVPEGGLAINTDQWDGYTHEREALLSHLHDRGIDNTVFLTGDIHMNWANQVPLTAATYPASPSVATEFVVTSVTSDNIDDLTGTGVVSWFAEGAVKLTNRHVDWVDMDSHGYGVLDITAERSQMDYYGLSDRRDPHATAAHLRSYRTLSGTQRLDRVDAPVR